MPDKRLNGLHCIPQKSWIGGVCAGLAYWLGLPLWIVRLIWGVAFFIYGVGLIPYLLLWIFVPNAKSVPGDYVDRTGDG